MPPRKFPTPLIRTAAMVRRRLLASCLVPLWLGSLAWAAGGAGGDWTPLTERLAADGFPRQEVEALFSRPEVLFQPDAMAGKLKELLKAQEAEASPLASALRTALYSSYLTPWAITRARNYAQENRALLEAAAARYGVPKEIIVSILLVETRLGQNTGQHGVFNRLASMASATDLEAIAPQLAPSLVTAENEGFLRRRCREKSDWAYEELKALLLYARREGIDPLVLKGSMYGAIGLCQFMPSNLGTFGVDADGDGHIDPFSKADALYSIANYLQGHGWRDSLDRDGRHRVIFAYNRSIVYANTVLAIAERMRKGW